MRAHGRQDGRAWYAHMGDRNGRASHAHMGDRNGRVRHAPMVGRMGAHDTHTWEAGWAGMMGNMADGMGGHGMHTWEIGMGGHDTHIWLDKMGGGIFAKTAKTPPLQSGVCGDFIACHIAIQMPSYYRCHAHTMPHMETPVFITTRHGEGGHSLRSAPPLPRSQ